MNDQKIQKLSAHYNNELSNSKVRTFFAPGRVNLIGEYTDYNGGLVFPCALQYGTYLIVTENTEGGFHFKSMNESSEASITFESLRKLENKQSSYQWANYPIGVLKTFRKSINANDTRGLNFYYYGDIPIGAGLSSSASLEVVTAYALNEILGCRLSLLELSLLSQKVENEFIGVNCGLMDQYAVAFGKKNHAIRLDCSTQSHISSAVEMSAHRFLIINSGKSRSLEESQYNVRRQECDEGLSIVNSNLEGTQKPYNYICDIDWKDVEALKPLMDKPIVYKRLKHTVLEHQRVKDFHLALQNEDIPMVGQLINESHQSLKDDYDVSGETLDLLVSIAQGTPGVLGARMTGAGFGGCIVCLVEADKTDVIYQTIREQYESQQGYKSEMYTVEISGGVRELTG